MSRTSYLLLFCFLWYCMGIYAQTTGCDGDACIRQATVELHSGEQVQGRLLSQNEKAVVLQTTAGQITLVMDDIKNIRFLPSQEKEVGESPTAYHADKPLIDIWFDPTGFTLDKGDFYFSFLSWGFGLTDRLQVTTSWYRYFSGDLNLRLKYKIFESRSPSMKQALSFGGHMHTASFPDKYEFKAIKRLPPDTEETDQAPDSYLHEDSPTHEWVKVGQQNNKYDDETLGGWGELFVAYTLSTRRDGGGRINYTLGSSAVFFPNAPIMPRVYLAIDMDVHENFKVLGQVFYDPYYLPMNDNREDDIDVPLFFDVGFMTNKILGVDNLWLGVHFQKPIVSGYYRF